MAGSHDSERPVPIDPELVVDLPTNGTRPCAVAYRSARREIERLEPGQTLLYHEGLLISDAATDPTIAGWAAAFRDAAVERSEGVLVQRRLRARWYQYLFLRAG